MDSTGPMLLTARREVLAGVGALAAVSLPMVACAQERQAAQPRGRRLITGSSCPVTPRQTEGPFYFDPSLVRRDIKEDRRGSVLRLTLQIVAADDCAPARQARVDIWHCDAAGDYSGYDREGTDGATWLRGTQFTDADGVVSFETIYPGWYGGRAPHVHVKAWLADRRELISQIYFADEVSDRIYGQPLYAGRTGRRLRNGDDGIFRRLGGTAPVAAIGPTDIGLDGAVVLALS